MKEAGKKHSVPRGDLIVHLNLQLAQLEGKSGGAYVYRDSSRAGSAYGEHPHVNATITQLPLPFLAKVLRGT